MNLYDVVEQKRNQILRESITSDEFMEFMKKNMEPYETLLTYYRCAIMEVETKFNVLNEQFSLQYDRNPIESVKSRLKSTESLIKKIRKKNIPLTVEAIEKNITDIAGVRVVCSFPEDIYLLADCLLQQDDITLIEKKDYIENPKPSGYRSLHLIVEVPVTYLDKTTAVRVEIQIRSVAMDYWAELDSQMCYKKDAGQLEAVEKATKQYADVIAGVDKKMLELRKKIQKM